MPKPSIHVRNADWPQDEAAIAAVRRAVFIDEQAVPEALEWEAQDPLCTWYVASFERLYSRQVVMGGTVGEDDSLSRWRERVGVRVLANPLRMPAPLIPGPSPACGRREKGRHPQLSRIAPIDGAVIGIVRLTPEGRIGRMAVSAPWRKQGVGGALLAAVLDEARRRGLPGVHLCAQTHAVSFYARFGFTAVGGVYLDAGIPHISMTLTFEELP